MQWLNRLMFGRYGSDTLNNALLILSLILVVLRWITGWQVLIIFVVLLLGLCYFRMFSRNIQARYAENQKFMGWWQPINSKRKNKIAQWHDRKYHKYFKCPACKNTLRVPRGHGRINVTCPKCKHSFVKKS